MLVNTSLKSKFFHKIGLILYGLLIFGVLFLVGSYNVDAQTLNESKDININAVVPSPEPPYVHIWASYYTVSPGTTVRIFWQTEGVDDVNISEFGNVPEYGFSDVVINEPKIYTIFGTTSDGTVLSDSIFINVVYITPTATPTPTEIIPPSLTPTVLPTSSPTPTFDLELCPTIIELKIEPRRNVPYDSQARIFWKVLNAQSVKLDGKIVPINGDFSFIVRKDHTFVLTATNGECVVSRMIDVNVVSNSVKYSGALAFSSFLALQGLGIIISTIGSLSNNWYTDLWLGLNLFFERLRGRFPFGVVYDSVSKNPINEVPVRLYDLAKQKIVQSSVTYLYGIYFFKPRVGSYKLLVEARNYRFPSKLVKGKTDGRYDKLYFGEDFSIKDKKQPVLFNVPIDPLERKKVYVNIWHKIKNLILNIIVFLLYILETVGFVYSLWAYYKYPCLYNLLVLVGYLLFFIIRIYARRLVRVSYWTGKVTDSLGRPIKGLEIGLFDSDFEVLVAHTFTDSEGRYNFIVPEGNYYLMPIDSRYKIKTGNGKLHVSRKTHTFMGHNLMIIKKSFRVGKV